MKHLSNFYLFARFARLTLCGVCCICALGACGNDKQVEKQFVERMQQAIECVKNANTVETLTKAQEIRKSAYKIDGVEDLKATGDALKVIEEFESQQELAQERVFQNVIDEGVVPMNDDALDEPTVEDEQSDTVDILLEP